MKKLSLFLLAIITITSCEKSMKSERGIVVGDTITTASGLKYIFLKEGKGNKIKAGSKVKVYTDLYINDADTTIWTTATAKDSTFNFIHQKTSLIKGFTELHDYLYEGDKVIAILPDSLAYGTRGSGQNVPPNATLIYNPLVVKYVSEPKESMVDTLLSISRSEGVKSAIQFYEAQVNNKEYHSDIDDIMDILPEYNKDSLFDASMEFASYFKEKVNDPDLKQMFTYYEVNSLAAQKKFKEAIKLVQPLTQQKLNKSYWEGVLKNLQSSIK